MRHFASEQLAMAVQAYATAERCFDLSVEWTKARKAFGRPLARHAVVRHQLRLLPPAPRLRLAA